MQKTTTLVMDEQISDCWKTLKPAKRAPFISGPNCHHRRWKARLVQRELAGRDPEKLDERAESLTVYSPLTLPESPRSPM
jgi:hypothetical protein